MRLVKDLLNDKDRDIWSIGPDDTVLEALKLMADKGIGALIVLEKEKVVGIFSERDYARKVILKGKLSKDTPVSDIMSKKVAYVTPDQTVDDCMSYMTTDRIRHLPVLDGEELVGLISIGDVVKAVITAQGLEIKQLETYVTGLLHGYC
ncbi:CBS domain-containing protein [Candidatus Neomarinimicrobiota bacterium]